MAIIDESIEIKRPVNEVFAYTTEAGSWPKWQSFIPEAARTSQGPVDVGTTFKGISHMMGRNMRWTAITTRYEPNRNWAKNITCGNLAIDERITCTPVEGGTNFTIVYNMKAGGFLRLLSILLARSMRRETKKSLGNLKRLLETHTP